MVRLEFDYDPGNRIWSLKAIDSSLQEVVNLDTSNLEIAEEVANRLVKQFIIDTRFHAKDVLERNDNY